MGGAGEMAKALLRPARWGSGILLPMRAEEARAALDRARKHRERVSVASRPPEDHGVAVTWAFYAYENCVVAAAYALAIPWKKRHPNKVAIARRLFKDGHVSRDIGDELERLNELRKDVQYGDPGLELLEVNLEALSAELERYVDEVAALLESKGVR